jgi:hypothetical protein
VQCAVSILKGEKSVRAKQITVKINPEDIPILEEYARRNGHTLSGYLRFIVHEWVGLITGNLDPIPASSVAPSAEKKVPEVTPPDPDPAPGIDDAPADSLTPRRNFTRGLLNRNPEED